MVFQNIRLGMELFTGRSAFFGRGGIALDNGADLFQPRADLFDRRGLMGESLQDMGGVLRGFAGGGSSFLQKTGGLCSQRLPSRHRPKGTSQKLSSFLGLLTAFDGQMAHRIGNY